MEGTILNISNFSESALEDIRLFNETQAKRIKENEKLNKVWIKKLDKVSNSYLDSIKSKRV
tara:strand:+ start:3295 stop:3477 length:183 start_codon:yes stop_codon:yes gene_type:complete